jgi:hypothetical protein
MKSKLLKRLSADEVAGPTPDHPAAIKDRIGAKRKPAIEPEVGIFFVYDGNPFIEGTPVSEAETYGNFKGHPTGHPAFWRTLQRNGAVPSDVEYDEAPRGRVGYNTKERKFYVFADPCILKESQMIDRIKRDLNLPLADTAPPKFDSHYRCPTCMKTDKQREQEEADWDF